jgi:hypothetical protein
MASRMSELPVRLSFVSLALKQNSNPLRNVRKSGSHRDPPGLRIADPKRCHSSSFGVQKACSIRLSPAFRFGRSGSILRISLAPQCQSWMSSIRPFALHHSRGCAALHALHAESLTKRAGTRLGRHRTVLRRDFAENSSPSPENPTPARDAVPDATSLRSCCGLPSHQETALHLL